MRGLFIVLVASLFLLGCPGGGGSGPSSFFGGGGGGDDIIPGAHSPEPTTIILFGLGAAGLLAAKRKRKR